MILLEIFEEVVANNLTRRALTVQGIRHKTEILFQSILSTHVAHEVHEAADRVENVGVRVTPQWPLNEERPSS